MDALIEDATFIKEEELWKIDSNDYIKIKWEDALITIINAPSPDEIREVYGFEYERN